VDRAPRIRQLTRATTDQAAKQVLVRGVVPAGHLSVARQSGLGRRTRLRADDGRPGEGHPLLGRGRRMSASRPQSRAAAVHARGSARTLRHFLHLCRKCNDPAWRALSRWSNSVPGRAGCAPDRRARRSSDGTGAGSAHPLGHHSEGHWLSPLPSRRALLGASLPWLACTTPCGAVTCGRNLGLWVRCGIVDVNADRQAKADASVVLSMPVG
jgi:hypothetical protein